MNLFLAAAPQAQVVHGELACMLSLNDLADRPPHAVGDDDVLDIGRHRLRFLPTPHVPHNWESGLWFDETTSHAVRRRPVHAHRRRAGPSSPTTSSGRRWPPRTCSTPRPLGPAVPPTLERLADLEPTTLAVMHGSSYRGDGGTQLRALAAGYAALLAEAA